MRKPSQKVFYLAKEGDLLIAEIGLIGFQSVEKEPKEESLLPNEKTTIPILLPRLKIPQG